MSKHRPLRRQVDLPCDVDGPIGVRGIVETPSCPWLFEIGDGVATLRELGEAEAPAIDFVLRLDNHTAQSWFHGSVRFSRLLQTAESFQGSLFAAVCATGLLLSAGDVAPPEPLLERWP